MPQTLQYNITLIGTEGTGKKKKLSPHEQTVRQVVAEHHDATLVDFVQSYGSGS